VVGHAHEIERRVNFDVVAQWVLDDLDLGRILTLRWDR
jgi:hypothetical protein